jgi:2-methylcitrate dehydratase PrpD
MADIAFKPHACGTMTQPFIDCAIALRARGVQADDIQSITCEVGEGTVHRLWEPLGVKHAPPTPYAAKFSTPFCIAVGFLDGRAGFGQFTAQRIADPAARALAAKVRYVVDPANEYPRNFTGHLRAVLRDGTVYEVRQPHMRGGARDPLSDSEIGDKFMDNVAYGGWDAQRGRELATVLDGLFAAPGLAALEAFRG